VKPIVSSEYRDDVSYIDAEEVCCPQCGCTSIEMECDHEGCDYNEVSLFCPDCGLELCAVVVLGCSLSAAKKIALNEWYKL